MKNKIEELLTYCAHLKFGDIKLSDDAKKFCKEWNNEIILLNKSLPDSTRIDAMLFFMIHSGLLTGLLVGKEINFLKSYYIPTWSIIYWLCQTDPDENKLAIEENRHARTAHSMAMFLHAIDDHLKDNQIPVTHLALLLRSQAWMIMNNAFSRLASEVHDGRQVLHGFINDYYSSIRYSKGIGSIDDYCELFRKQMAIGMVAPVLLIKKRTQDERFANAVQIAYGSFGIAWRLLDDINDIAADMAKGTHSAIYYSLPEDQRMVWDNGSKRKNNSIKEDKEDILVFITKRNIVNRIIIRICRELDFAASIMDDYHMKGWADEFRCLAKPLKYAQRCP